MENIWIKNNDLNANELNKIFLKNKNIWTNGTIGLLFVSLFFAYSIIGAALHGL